MYHQHMQIEEMDINKYNPELPIKGLNLDVQPDKQEKSTYRFALNTITDSIDGSRQAVSTEPGNLECLELDEGFVVIGSIYINDGDTVLILYKADGDITQIGIMSDECQYTKFIESDCFTLNECYQVKGEFKVRNGCERVITLYDCYSKDLYINLDDLSLYYNDAFVTYLETNPGDSPEDYFIATGLYAWDCNKMSLNPSLNYPCLEFDTILEGAGKLNVGVYKFKLELLDGDFNRLGFTNFIHPVPIVDDSLGSNWFNIDGATNDEFNPPETGGVPATNNAIRLNIDDIEAPISYIRLVVKYYVNSDGFTAGLTLKSNYIDVRQTTSTTILFDFLNSNIDLPITEDEAITPKQVYSVSCVQEQINGRLIRANLKEEDIDWASVQRSANTIKSEYEFIEEEAETNIGSNTKNPNYYAFNRSYMRDEVYAFGIVLKLKNGVYSPAFHIPGREALVRADVIPPHATGAVLSVISAGNSNQHNRNQVPITEDNWDFQLLEVTQNPTPAIKWTNAYNQVSAGFDPDTQIIFDNVEHLGLSNYQDNILGYGNSGTVNNGALVPRWMVFNTGIAYGSGSLLPNRGIMAYHELNTRYPKIKDCDGNFVYPVDSLDPTNTAFIRHHKFPDFALTKHYQESVDINAVADKKIYPIGIVFDTTAFYASLPINLLDKIDGHIFVRAERTNNNKTVLDKGIYSVATENWKDGNFNLFLGSPDAERIAGNFVDISHYEPVHYLCCTGSVGMFHSPMLQSFRTYLGNSFYMKNEVAIKPRFLTQTTGGSTSPPYVQFMNYDQYTDWIVNDEGYEFFDMRSNLAIPYCDTQTSKFPYNDSDPFPIVPHYRARFENRLVENSKILSPESNVDLDILASIGGRTSRIISFKNVLQTNSVMIFENLMSLPRGIIQNTGVNVDPTDITTPVHPMYDDGQAGWNAFYVGLKANRQVYTNITSMPYIPLDSCTSYEASFADLQEPLFGGDTFITRFTYSKYFQNVFPYKPDLNVDNGYLALAIAAGDSPDPFNWTGFNGSGGVSPYSDVAVEGRNQINTLITTYVESSVNLNLRHSGTEECNKYFEKDYNRDVNDYLSDFLQTKGCQDYFAYNTDYSIETTEDKFFPISETFNFCLDCQNEYPNRIAWSPVSFEEEIADKWKINNANDYIDIPANRGAITNLKFDKNQLLITTEESLYQMTPNPQVLQTDVSDIQVGTGDFLSIAPKEFVKKPIGFAGNQGRFNAVSTEFGWTWVDQKEGKVFNSSGEGLIEISKRGMYHWFRNNLPSFFEKRMKLLSIPYDCTDNTASWRGVGLFATYDPKFERYILHKSDYDFTPGALEIFGGLLSTADTPGNIYYDILDGAHDSVPGEVHFYIWYALGVTEEIFFSNRDYFVNKSWTMSYSYKDQSWISWHSYQPNYMFFNNYTFFTYIKPDPLITALASIIYSHGFRNYTNFYGVQFPHTLEFVVSDINTMNLHNIYWYGKTELYDDVNLINLNIDDITYTNMIAYNDRQSTGDINLVMKVDDEDNLDYVFNRRLVIKKDENCRVSLIRNTVNTPTTALFTSNWDEFDYNAQFGIINGYQGYIDKVTNQAIIGAEMEDLSDLTGKYFIVRLTYNKDFASPDCKLTLNLAQTAELYSIR